MRLASRIKETSTTTGTGSFTLANTVVAGYLRFADIPGIATGEFVPYVALDDSATPATWESGWGSYNTSTHVLTRSVVTENSLGTTATINFSNAPTVFLSGERDLLMAAPGMIGVRAQAGRFYTMPGIMVSAAWNGNFTFTPFYLANAAALTTMSAKINSPVNGNTLRLGLYTDNNGAPGTLIVQASTPISSSNANTVVTLTTSETLAPGIYWACVGAPGGATQMTCYAQAAGGGAYGFSNLFSGFGHSAASDALSSVIAFYTSTDSTGSAMPATPAGLAWTPSTVAPVVALGF
jgi:hypothetical protein